VNERGGKRIFSLQMTRNKRAGWRTQNRALKSIREKPQHGKANMGLRRSKKVYTNVARNEQRTTVCGLRQIEFPARRPDGSRRKLGTFLMGCWFFPAEEDRKKYKKSLIE